jgi:hypothetical protein
VERREDLGGVLLLVVGLAGDTLSTLSWGERGMLGGSGRRFSCLDGACLPECRSWYIPGSQVEIFQALGDFGTGTIGAALSRDEVGGEIHIDLES